MRESEALTDRPGPGAIRLDSNTMSHHPVRRPGPPDQPARPHRRPPPASCWRTWVAERGLPGYRAGQILRRLWQAPVAAWSEATELPLGRSGRSWTRPFRCPAWRRRSNSVSADGTRKYLWRLADGEAIESVLIPSGGRRTLCISLAGRLRAQAARSAPPGRWASGGTSPPSRSRARCARSCSATRPTMPTNVVFMGMGEPLLNWPAVDTALTILNAPDGLGIGARHITVSTVGILPGMAGVRPAAGAVPAGHLAPCPDVGAAARHHADREEVRPRGGARRRRRRSGSGSPSST